MHANYSRTGAETARNVSLSWVRYQQNFFTHPQIATSKISGRGGRRYLPYAFTEHGAIMAATVLNSPRAVEMSVYVVRAVVKLRELLASNKELARRLDELEARIEKKLATHDQAIAAILSAIRQLMNPPPPKHRPIGFTADLTKKS